MANSHLTLADIIQNSLQADNKQEFPHQNNLERLPEIIHINDSNLNKLSQLKLHVQHLVIEEAAREYNRTKSAEMYLDQVLLRDQNGSSSEFAMEKIVGSLYWNYLLKEIQTSLDVGRVIDVWRKDEHINFKSELIDSKKTINNSIDDQIVFVENKRNDLKYEQFYQYMLRRGIQIPDDVVNDIIQIFISCITSQQLENNDDNNNLQTQSTPFSTQKSQENGLNSNQGKYEIAIELILLLLQCRCITSQHSHDLAELIIQSIENIELKPINKLKKLQTSQIFVNNLNPALLHHFLLYAQGINELLIVRIIKTLFYVDKISSLFQHKFFIQKQDKEDFNIPFHPSLTYSYYILIRQRASSQQRIQVNDNNQSIGSIQFFFRLLFAMQHRHFQSGLMTRALTSLNIQSIIRLLHLIAHWIWVNLTKSPQFNSQDSIYHSNSLYFINPPSLQQSLNILSSILDAHHSSILLELHPTQPSAPASIRTKTYQSLKQILIQLRKYLIPSVIVQNSLSSDFYMLQSLLGQPYKQSQIDNKLDSSNLDTSIGYATQQTNLKNKGIQYEKRFALPPRIFIESGEWWQEANWIRNMIKRDHQLKFIAKNSEQNKQETAENNEKIEEKTVERGNKRRRLSSPIGDALTDKELQQTSSQIFEPTYQQSEQQQINQRQVKIAGHLLSHETISIISGRNMNKNLLSQNQLNQRNEQLYYENAPRFEQLLLQLEKVAGIIFAADKNRQTNAIKAPQLINTSLVKKIPSTETTLKVGFAFDTIKFT